jgi:hypothetical protein
LSILVPVTRLDAVSVDAGEREVPGADDPPPGTVTAASLRIER